MYFYLSHSLVGKDDRVFNTRTIMIGLSLYVLTAALFYSGKYHSLVNSFFLLSAIRDSFLWILAIDVLAMFAVYKLNQGRTILKEVQENQTMASSEEDVHEVPRVEDVDVDVEVEKEVEVEKVEGEKEVEEVTSDDIEVEEVASDELEAEEATTDDIEVDEDLEAKKE
jgi:hypothetical protein